MKSHEVMKALAVYANTLGWELLEWDWKDESDGDEEYTVWLRESRPTDVESDGESS